MGGKTMWVVAGAMALTACAGAGRSSGAQLYRCEQGIAFKVRFVDDSALLEGSSRAEGVLFRDAGGQGPQQTVYSNTQMRAEFGLGTHGREAQLKYPLLPLAVRCVRD